MSEQPPKVNQPDKPTEPDVTALLGKFNTESHKQQPDSGTIEKLNQQIAETPVPEQAPPEAVVEGEVDQGVSDTEQWLNNAADTIVASGQLDTIYSRLNKAKKNGKNEPSEFRKALYEEGVVPSDSKLTIAEVWHIINRANRRNSLVAGRKNELIEILTTNPEIMDGVQKAVNRAYAEYMEQNPDSKGKEFDPTPIVAARLKDPKNGIMGEGSDIDELLTDKALARTFYASKKVKNERARSAAVEKEDRPNDRQRQPSSEKASKDHAAVQQPAVRQQQSGKKEPLPRYKDGSAMDDGKDPYDGRGQLTGWAKIRAEEVAANKASGVSPEVNPQKNVSERIGALEGELEKIETQIREQARTGKEGDSALRAQWEAIYQELSDLKLRQSWGRIAMPGLDNPENSQPVPQQNRAEPLPAIDLSGLEPPEKLTVAQQEERWMRLVQQYSVSNGDRGLKQQVDEAYNALQEMRSSPETLAELRQELSELSQQYGKQFDKNSPEARELARAAAAKYNEIQALEQWQATNAESARAGKLPRVELPDDPLDPDGAGRLPRVTLPDDPLNVRHNQQPNDLRQQVLEAAAAYEQAEEGEAKEQARARYEALQAQLRAAENPPANEPLTKQAELDNLRKAYLDESDPTKRIEKKKLFEEAYNEWKAWQEHVAEETIKIRAEVANETEAGKEVTYGERLRAAMDRYTKLKADSETKGIDIKLGRITLWRGRAKREKLLKEAEAELMAAKIAYENVVKDKVHDANLYEGTDEQIEAQCRNDFFTAVRRLDIETRQAVNDELEDRKENRNIFKRAATTIFGWMGKSGKLRTAGTIGAGAAAGVGIVMSGAAWPITAAVVGGAKFAIYHGVKTKQLDDMRAETVDANGNAKGVMTDADFEDVKSTAVKSGASVEATAQGIATEIFDTSRQQGYERVDRATQAARRAIGKFGIGVAIGAGGVGAYRAISGLAEASATPGNGGGDKPPAEGGDKPPAEGGEIKGKSFYVEGGSGLIRELRQFATANGVELTATEEGDLHRDLMKEFGKDYIDIRGVKSDIYTHGGDVRLSAPGKATWEEGVPEFIQKWMERKGLWK